MVLNSIRVYVKQIDTFRSDDTLAYLLPEIEVPMVETYVICFQRKSLQLTSSVNLQNFFLKESIKLTIFCRM